MKKPLALLLACIVAVALGGCANSPSNTDSAPSSSASQTVEMNYLSAAEVKALVEKDDGSFIVIDARKASDYQAGHIAGAVNADMDLAKDGNTESGIANMSAALEQATGSKTGDGKTIVIACYSGNRYARAATIALNSLGADLTNVYTLEGGMRAWSAAYPDAVVTE